MPRNGSGTETVPNQFAPNTVISSSEMNANFTDVAAEITNSLALDGQSVMTGQVKGANGSAAAPAYSFGTDLNTGLYRVGADNPGVAVGGVLVEDWAAAVRTMTIPTAWPVEVTVASATTCDILAAAADTIAISGTTTITGLGTGANRFKRVRFTGILTLTHNATSLILPGGANITTAAGDTMEVQSDGSSNARVITYQRAGVVPLQNPAATLISSGSLPAAAVKDFTSISPLYRRLQLVIIGASSDTATRKLQVQISVDNGSNYLAANYQGASLDGVAVTVCDSVFATSSVTAGAAATFNMNLDIINYQGGSYPKTTFDGLAGSTYFAGGASYNGGTSAVNALRILWNGSGNFDAGTYALYGIS